MTRLVERCGVFCVRGADETGERRVEGGCLRLRNWSCRCRRPLRRRSQDNPVVGRQGIFQCVDTLGG
jgi:hypothetical protein